MDVRVAVLAGDKWLGAQVSAALRANGDSMVHWSLVNRAVSTAEFLERINPDWIVTAYWPYLLSPAAVAVARKGTVNLHPSLLPLNRGWYPYVHNILDGSPAGVSLAEIAPQAGAGRIWAQHPVQATPYDTAYTLRKRLRSQIALLFRQTWPDIAAGKIVPEEQDEARATYHKRSEILGCLELDPDADTTVRDVVRVLRARSFGNEGFAFYADGDDEVYLNLRLSGNTSFRENPECATVF